MLNYVIFILRLAGRRIWALLPVCDNGIFNHHHTILHGILAISQDEIFS
jgi:hypothetical protein